MHEFYLGQIFEDEYPPEAAEWCNEGQVYHIDEIEPDGETRRFQIVENEVFEDDLDPYVDPVDEAICSLYEMVLELQNDRS